MSRIVAFILFGGLSVWFATAGFISEGWLSATMFVISMALTVFMLGAVSRPLGLVSEEE